MMVFSSPFGRMASFRYSGRMFFFRKILPHMSKDDDDDDGASSVVFAAVMFLLPRSFSEYRRAAGPIVIWSSFCF